MAAAAKTAAPKPYGALVGGNAVFAGVDQGIDFTGAGPVYALDAGNVTRSVASGSGWPGQGAVLNYKLTAGPYKNQSVYVAEDFRAAAGIAQGSVVQKGQIIGYATGSGLAPGIEVGFAGSSGSPLAPLDPAHPHAATGFGTEFDTAARLLSSGPYRVQEPGSAADNFSVDFSGSGGKSAGSVASAAANHVPGVVQAKSVAEFLSKITDPKVLQRAGEMLAGGVLILVGVVMVGRAASSSGPVAQTAGAVKAVTPAGRAVSRSKGRPRSASPQPAPPRKRASTGLTSRQNTGRPLSQSSARARRQAGFTLAADRKPTRGQPGSSRPARGDKVPF